MAETTDTKLTDAEIAASKKLARTLHRIEVKKTNSEADAGTINKMWAEQRTQYMPIGRRMVRALTKSGIKISQ